MSSTTKISGAGAGAAFSIPGVYRTPRGCPMCASGYLRTLNGADELMAQSVPSILSPPLDCPLLVSQSLALKSETGHPLFRNSCRSRPLARGLRICATRHSSLAISPARAHDCGASCSRPSLLQAARAPRQVVQALGGVSQATEVTERITVNQSHPSRPHRFRVRGYPDHTATLTAAVTRLTPRATPIQ
jgi:hypothetical protein